MLPGFTFTTSLLPALGAGARAAIRRLKHSQRERAHHDERVGSVKRRLAATGLPVMPSQSHIVPILVGDPVHCKTISGALLQRHRLTPSPLHSDADIDVLVDALVDVWHGEPLRQAA